ncbi:MAG: cohesin domain-containing protein [Peptostreptococcaceae bacterium]|jgi:hypothetical protein|nr:cohesin domain-containing protein [Peptostreptococcaceae bacterium]
MLKKNISKNLIALTFFICIFIISKEKAFAIEIGDYVTYNEEGWDWLVPDNEDKVLNIGDGQWSRQAAEQFIVLDEDQVAKQELRFTFKGDGLRIIFEGSSNNAEYIVTIDGKTEKFRTYGTYNSVSLGYKKEDLENKVHNVSIKFGEYYGNYGGKSYYGFDAFQIRNGEVLDYDNSFYNKVLDVEPEKSVIKLNEDVNVNLTIDNINDITAEDIRINYDSEKLEYLGSEEIPGMKLVKDLKNDGELRFIIASQGESYIIKEKEILLKLKFKGIDVGEALVNINKGRVTDGIEMEKELTENECGETTIIIEESELLDVNKSGEFTLLDLGIDARHLNKNPNSQELLVYNTDIIQDGNINNLDLLEIGKLILENNNYQPNNY